MSDAPLDTRRAQDRPRSWPERLAAVVEKFPDITDERAQVREALCDYDLIGRVMRDVLRVGWEARKRGQRAPLEWSDGSARLRSLAAERAGRITTKPFVDAFRELAAGVTLDAVARGTSISRSQVHRLLHANIPPTTPELIAIAQHFGKPPTYFHEYRVHLILASFEDQLTLAPERSVDVLVRLGVVPLDDDE